jgi:hypothetical protein
MTTSPGGRAIAGIESNRAERFAAQRPTGRRPRAALDAGVLTLSALLSLAAAHCSHSSGASAAPADAASPSAATTTATTAASASPPPVAAGILATEYRGALGDGLAVVVRLKRDQDQVSGSYFYEKTGGSLALDGLLNGTHLVLDELADKAKTGAIDAELASDGSLTGFWTDVSKKRALPLHLVPIPQDAAPSSALLFKRARHETRPVVGRTSKSDVCKADLDYAEVFGLPAAAEAKINQLLAPSADLLPPKVCDHIVETSTGYEVKHNANGLLSVIVTGSVGDSQAAHPDSGSSPFTVWLATGADVKLYGEIVGPGDAPAIQHARAASLHRLAHQAGEDADTERMVLESFGDPPPFVVEKQGISLCVAPPHVVANLGGCQYPIPVSGLPHLRDRAAALWSK